MPTIFYCRFCGRRIIGTPGSSWSRCSAKHGGAHEWNHYELSQEEINEQNRATEESAAATRAVIVFVVLVVGGYFCYEAFKAGNNRIKEEPSRNEVSQARNQKVSSESVMPIPTATASAMPMPLAGKVRWFELYRRADDPLSKSIRVKTVDEHSPAFDLGVEREQQIVSINKIPTTFKTPEVCYSIIENTPESQKVEIEIRVDAAQTKVITLLK